MEYSQEVKKAIHYYKDIRDELDYVMQRISRGGVVDMELPSHEDGLESGRCVAYETTCHSEISQSDLDKLILHVKEAKSKLQIMAEEGKLSTNDAILLGLSFGNREQKPL